MQTALELTEFLIVVSAVLTYIGYGATKLILPISLWRWRWLLTPFVGYALILVTFRVLHTYLLSGEQCVVVLLAAATVVNAYALIRCRRFRRRPSVREMILPLVIAGVVYVVAVIPLLSYGQLTIVGTNGDVDFYLGSAEYIRHYSAPALTSAPTSPLRNLTVSAVENPIGGAGASYLLAAIITVLNWPALNAFAPMMAMLTAAGGLATYLFARSVLALSRPASALAALALGLNGLILWTGLFNYGRQMSVLPLLPVAAIACVVCLNQVRWRSVACAGLLVAAVVICYWSATLWLVAAIGVYLAIVAIVRRRIRMALVAGGAVTILGFLPLARSMPSYLGKLAAVFSDNLVEGEPIAPASIIDHFLPLDHLYGLAYYVWPSPEPLTKLLDQRIAPAIIANETVFLAAFLALDGLALWHLLRRRRFAAFSLVLVSVLLLGVAQFVLSDTYGYFKAITFTSFVAVTVSVYGFSLAWRYAARVRVPAVRMTAAACVAVFGVAFVGLSASNAFFTVSHFAGLPRSAYVPEFLAVAEVDRFIEPSSSLHVTDAPALQNWAMSPIVYALFPHPLNGLVELPNHRFRTGSVNALDRYVKVLAGKVRRASELYLSDYAVLSVEEDPAERGYSPEGFVWGNNVLSVYGRGSTVAHADFDRAIGGSPITKTARIRLAVGGSANQASSAATPDPTESVHSLAFEMGTTMDQRVSISINGERYDHELKPGLWRWESPPVSLTATVTLTTELAEPVYLQWVQLREATDAPSTLQQVEDYFVLQSTAITESAQSAVNVKWTGPESSNVPGWLELRVRTTDPNDAGTLLGTWPLSDAVQSATVTLNNSDGSIEASNVGFSNKAARWGSPKEDGQFVADMRLVRASDDHPDDVIRVSDLFTATVTNGRVTDFKPSPAPFVHKYLPSKWWNPVDVTFGDLYHLEGYTVDSADSKSSDSVDVTLYWRVPKGVARDWRVITQLVDGDGQGRGSMDVNLQSATAFAYEACETEVLRTNHHIPLDEGVPAGEYGIKVQMYSPATNAFLSTQAADQPFVDNTLLGPVQVKPQE